MPPCDRYCQCNQLADAGRLSPDYCRAGPSLERRVGRGVAGYREAVRLLESPAGEKSTGRILGYGMALIQQAEILGKPRSISLDRPAEAVAGLRHALEISEEFARRDPSDFQSQYRIFSAETKLADIIRNNQPDHALKMYDDGLRRLAGAAGNAETLRNETITLAASTYPRLRVNQPAEARKRLDGAFERLKLLKQYPAASIDPGSPAQDTLRALAEYEAYRGNLARAEEIYTELIRLIRASDLKEKTSLEDAVDLSEIYSSAAPVIRRDDLAWRLAWNRSGWISGGTGTRSSPATPSSTANSKLPARAIAPSLVNV